MKTTMTYKEAFEHAIKVLNGAYGKEINICFIMESDGEYNVAYSWDERKYAEECGWKLFKSVGNIPTVK